jgi:2-dehydro-3-deoxygluconokinase
MSQRVVTFGEVMGRIAAPGLLRFAQALPGGVGFTFGGGEANVAVSLALLGGEARFVSAVPSNPIGDACVATLRGVGVETSGVQRRADGRLGLYYLEAGANQRASVVTYDRDGSALMLTPPEAYDWAALFADAGWFHVTGITPALCENTAAAALAATQAAQAAGLTVSCDLNYRKKLWNWRPGTPPRALAEETLRALLPFVDVVIANEEDAAQVLGISAEGTDVAAGRLDVGAYRAVAAEIVRQFPNVRTVAITLRESLSATHNNWGGLLYDAHSEDAYYAPTDVAGAYAPYEIRDIVDRVGGGDAFAAGLIFALTSGAYGASDALRFAVAASCLKHSIPGDFNYATRAEVEALMGGDAGARVQR